MSKTGSASDAADTPYPGGWPSWIGLRYLRARQGNRYVGFISVIAMTGIALGVAVLIVVLSVMNGFERDLSRRILDIVAHATLEGEGARLDDWRALMEKTRSDAGVVAIAPYVEGRAMLVAGERSAAVDLRAVLPDAERKVSALEKHLSDGGFNALVPGAWQVLLGRGLAGKLGVRRGDGVLVVIAQGNVTPAGVAPRMRRFMVAGFIDAGMYEFDQGLAVVHLGDAQRLFRLGDSVTGLRYRFDDPNSAPTLIRAIGQSLPGSYYISDWSRRQGNFFRSLQVTKSIMFFVLLLVVAVAAFNIIATLVMVVKEKRADIAILRTLGGAPRDMVSIFMTQGSVIGVVGTAIGTAVGLLLAFNATTVVMALQRATGITFVDPQVYFISELPSEVRLGDVVLVAGVALALGVLATLYPAWRAARTQPADALRHEV